MGIPEQIASAEERVVALEARLHSLTELFVRDGHISDNEHAALNEARMNIDRLRVAIENLHTQLAGPDAPQGFSITGDPNAELPPEVLLSRQAMLENIVSDTGLKNAFVLPLRAWCNSCKIDILKVSVEAVLDSMETDLSEGDILAVIALLIPGYGAVFGVTLSTLSTVVSALSIRDSIGRMIEPSARSGSSTADIIDELASTFDTISEEAENHFQIFAQAWLNQNYYETETDFEAIEAVVLADASSYVSDFLAPPRSAGQALLLRMMAHAEDSIDPDDEAGDAEITMTYLGDRTSGPDLFSIRDGQLDDISESFKRTIDRTFGRTTRVIDLPIKITIEIVSYSGSELAIIERTEQRAGSANFRRVSGDQNIIDQFMDNRYYARPLLQHLSYDFGF